MLAPNAPLLRRSVIGLSAAPPRKDTTPAPTVLTQLRSNACRHVTSAPIRAIDHGAHAGANHHINRDMQFLQHAQHANVRETAGASTGQGQGDARTAQGGRVRRGAGLGRCGKDEGAQRKRAKQKRCAMKSHRTQLAGDGGRRIACSRIAYLHSDRIGARKRRSIASLDCLRLTDLRPRAALPIVGAVRSKCRY
jgi:hypothetical protein